MEMGLQNYFLKIRYLQDSVIVIGKIIPKIKIYNLLVTLGMLHALQTIAVSKRQNIQLQLV